MGTVFRLSRYTNWISFEERKIVHSGAMHYMKDLVMFERSSIIDALCFLRATKERAYYLRGSEFSFAGHAYLFCLLLHCRCSKCSHTYNFPDHMHGLATTQQIEQINARQ